MFNQTHFFGKTWTEKRWGVKYNPEFPPVTLMDKIIVGPYLFWQRFSHTPLEFIPRFLYALEVLPKNIPVLTTRKNFPGQFMKYLIDIGYLDEKRIVEYEDVGTIFANEAYFSSEWPTCQNYCQRQYGIEYFGRMKRIMVPKDLPVEERDLIIWVQRTPGHSRYLSWEQIDQLKKMLNKYGKVVTFIGSEYKNMSSVIDLFKKAKVIISTHGAGLANLLFSAECTTVIELMFDDKFLQTPTAFYSASIARKLDYWMLHAKGGVMGPNVPNIDEIEDIMKQVMKEKEKLKKSKLHCWDLGNRNRQYIWDKRLWK